MKRIYTGVFIFLSTINIMAESISDDLAKAQEAMQAQQYDVAHFIYTRLQKSDPGHAQYALQDAKALYHLGALAQAQQELEALLATVDDDEITQAANQLLHEVKGKQLQLQRQVWVELGLEAGYDTNTNSSTTLDSIALPSAGSIIIDPNAKAQASPFATPSITLGGEYPVDEGNITYGSAKASQVLYTKDHENDTRSYVVNGGYHYQQGDINIFVPLQFENLSVDASNYVDFLSASINAYRQINNNTYGVSVEWQREWYDIVDDYNSTGWVAEVSWMHQNSPWQITVAPYVGDSDADQSSYSFSLAGVDLSTQYLNGGDWVPELHLNYQHDGYQAAELGQSEKREDDIFQVGPQLTQQVSDHFKWGISVEYQENHSNYDAYAYEKIMSYVFATYHL